MPTLVYEMNAQQPIVLVTGSNDAGEYTTSSTPMTQVVLYSEETGNYAYHLIPTADVPEGTAIGGEVASETDLSGV